MQIQRYVSKISGPLLDRIDIHIDVPAVKFKELASETPTESSAEIRDRVVRAPRSVGAFHHRANLLQRANVTAAHTEILRDQFSFEGAVRERHNATGAIGSCYDRILKAIRTLADLEGKETIEPGHISEAIRTAR